MARAVAPADRRRPRCRRGRHRAGVALTRGLRLHDLREVRRRRRHLAGQHLSRRRVRRAVAPVLVLVRAEPVVEPHLRDAARDPRLPRALHRPVRRATARAHRHRDHRARAGTTPTQQWELAAADRRDRSRADVVVSGLGMLNVPDRPRHPRRATGSAAARSTRRAGITASRSPASGSRRSAPARAPSSTCPRSRPRSSTSPCSSARRSGSRHGSTGRSRPRSNAASPACRSRRGCTAGRSGGRTSGRDFDGRRRADRDADRARAVVPRTQDRRIPSCGPSSRPTTRWAASGR